MSTLIDHNLAKSLLPARPMEGHKGTFGHVLIIGGARGYTGAVKMAGLAAARSGAGLVTLGVPTPLGDVVAAGLMEVMTHVLPAPPNYECLAAAAVEQALQLAENKEVVVLGPGIGLNDETQRFVLEFIPQCKLPMVIDADGLNAISTRPDVLKEKQGPIVLTPHPGEMARLAKIKTADIKNAREQIAAEFAAKYDCVVVLKGHRTVIAQPPDQICVNTTGNSGMATGGTGDVLSGLIGGLIAQQSSPWNAALLGVYAHGLAGDLAAAAKTQRGMIASDVIDFLPAAWRALEQGV